MDKTCTTCKYEPDWKMFDEIHAMFEAGRCKYPLPKTITPYIGKTKDTLYFKDHAGKCIVNTWSGDTCYAWEAK